MLLLTGLTRQLTDGAHISDSAPGNMILQATSSYVPDPAILDLAFAGFDTDGRSRDGVAEQGIHSFDQWIRHTVYEVDSRGPGFLISAGGLRSGPANLGLLAGVPVPGAGRTVDEGVAVPTTVMFTDDYPRQDIYDVMRIEGPKVIRNVNVDGHPVDAWSFDHNLCVWHGFACGMNIVTTSHLSECITNRVADPGGKWQFIDTASCYAFRGSKFRRFITIYKHECPADRQGCTDNFGFIHVADVTGSRSTASELMRTVMALNPSRERPLSPMSGRFTDPVRRDVIVWDSLAHQRDSSRWGVESVNGKRTKDLQDRERVEGEWWDSPERPPLSGKSDSGILVIHNNRMGVDLTLDFSDRMHPRYRRENVSRTTHR
jgi:hypothetical protein